MEGPGFHLCRASTRIGVEEADAFGGLLGGHRLIVELPSKILSAEIEFWEVAPRGEFGAGFARHRRGAVFDSRAMAG